MVFSRIDISLN